MTDKIDLGGGHSPRELDVDSGAFVDDFPGRAPGDLKSVERASGAERAPAGQIDTYGSLGSKLASLLQGKRASGPSILGAGLALALLGLGWRLLGGGNSRRRRLSWLELARPSRRSMRRAGPFGLRF
jgi:hypothetical protein